MHTKYYVVVESSTISSDNDDYEVHLPFKKK